MKKRMMIITFICLFIDQISKIVITNMFDVNTGKSIISSFFSILYVRNTGAAWGMLDGKTLFLAILSIFFLICAIKYIIGMKDLRNIETISFGMLFGGVIGNLIDRIARNYVVDFISFKIFNYDFPVFNIADSFIVISIFLIVIDSFLNDRRKSVVKNNDSEGK